MRKTQTPNMLARAVMMLFAVLCFSGGLKAQSSLTIYENATVINSTVPVYGMWADAYLKCEFIVPDSELIPMSGGAISQMTFYLSSPASEAWTGTFQVFLKEVESATISAYSGTDDATIVYTGTLDATGSTMSIDFQDTYTYGGGNLLVGIYQTEKGIYKSASFIGETVTGASIGGYSSSSLDEVGVNPRNFIPKTTFSYIPGGSVFYFKPNNLTVDDLTDATASLSWTAPSADVASYVYQYKEASEEDWGDEVAVTETTVSLDDLLPGTSYDFHVKAVYNDGGESGYATTTFMTEFCAEGDKCFISYELTDSYGDGWSNNAIKVVDVETGVVLDTWTIAGSISSASGSLAVCTGREIQFQWVSGGSYSYPEECSYVVKDVNDEIIFEGSGAMAEPVNYTVDCTAAVVAKPTNLTASEVGSKSATLSWTENGEATAWEICLNDDENNLVAANVNPFTLTNLTPETTYTAKVRATNGNEVSVWSQAVTFTTAVAYPAPTNVIASDATDNSVVISWTGNDDANSYNLRYRSSGEGIVLFSDDFENGLDQWTILRNGDEGTDYTDWRQFDPSLFQNPIPAYSGNYVAMSRSWSSSSYHVDNWLISPQVDLGGTMTYWVMDDGEYHEHYDIYVSTTGTNVDDFTLLFEPGDASDEWTEVSVDLSNYAGQQGYIAFRHTDYDKDFLFIDDVTIRGASASATPGEWIEENGVISPYQIEGLAAETLYEVQVQAVYADGESKWVNNSFQTLKENAVPFNLAADVQADGVTLTWDGSGESYNVQYRTAADQEKLFFEDFENGLPDNWSTIDADGDGNNWIAVSELGTVYPFYAGKDLSDYVYNGNDAVISASAYNNEDGNSYTALDSDNWLISPLLNLEGTLKFYVKALGGYGDEFEVLLSTNGTEAADFTTTLQEMTAATSGWTEVSIPLADYEGQQGYIAIHHVFSDGYFLVVDDFGLYEPIEAGEWQEIAVSEATVTLSDLEPNTTYEYQVQSVKGEETSDWSSVATFTTLEASVLELVDGKDNLETIEEYAQNGYIGDVKLTDRTLYKDGGWNTLVLPFAVEDIDATPLAGAIVKTLESASFDNGTLTLNFTDDSENLTALDAGVPYIVKWEEIGDNIVDPVFSNVKISAETENVETDVVSFIGTYNTIDFGTEVNTSVFLMGAGNTLFYPNGESNSYVNTCRAYFQLADGYELATDASVGQNAKVVRVDFNFGDGHGIATGIVSLDDSQNNAGVYTLSGVKLDKATKKGVYIQNGRKVVIGKNR